MLSLAGTCRAQGRQDSDNLYACPQPRPCRCSQPYGHTLRGGFILIRITHMNKFLDEREIIEKKYVSKPSAKYIRASYTDRN